MGFHRYLDEQVPDIMTDLREEKALSDELSERLVAAINAYTEDFEA